MTIATAATHGPLGLICPSCSFAFVPKEDGVRRAAGPWHIRDRAALRSYVASLGEERHEWLLALFVDEHLGLLAVETIARGGVSEVRVDFRAIVRRGFQLGAAGFLLAHNHPSGDPRPSGADLAVTSRLRELAGTLGMPLIEHVIVAGGELRAIGWDAELRSGG